MNWFRWPSRTDQLWDHELIGEGVALSGRRDGHGPGRLTTRLQAAIAALHDEALSADDTDWPQILALYGSPRTA